MTLTFVLKINIVIYWIPVAYVPGGLWLGGGGGGGGGGGRLVFQFTVFDAFKFCLKSLCSFMGYMYIRNDLLII